MSVTGGGQGFVAGGLACGIKESGAPDLAIVADRGPRAGRRGRRVHDEPRAGGAGAGQHAAPRRRARRGGRAQLRQRERGDRRSRAGADAPRMCALTGDGLGVAPDDVLVCSTGLIGIPMPMAPIETGHPEAVRAGLEPTAGSTRRGRS